MEKTRALGMAFTKAQHARYVESYSIGNGCLLTTKAGIHFWDSLHDSIRRDGVHISMQNLEDLRTQWLLAEYKCQIPVPRDLGD
jgi:hypothetical protein